MESAAGAQLLEQAAAFRKRKRERRREVQALQKRARQARNKQALGQALWLAGAASFEDAAPESSPDVRRVLSLGHQTTIVLMLFVLSDFCTDAVVSYTLGQGRPDHDAGPGYDATLADVRRNVTAGIESAYNCAPLDVIVGLFEDAGVYRWLGRVMAASRYIVEYHLFHWLVHQNCDNGVAPGSSEICVAACTFVPSKAPARAQDQLRRFLLANNRAAYYWLVSFRRRWGGKIGKLQLGTNLTLVEMESTATWSE